MTFNKGHPKDTVWLPMETHFTGAQEKLFPRVVLASGMHPLLEVAIGSLLCFFRKGAKASFKLYLS